MLFDTLLLRTIVATSVITAPVASTQAAESPSATQYLTPHTVAALTVRIADAVRQPAAQNYPLEVLSAATEDYLGLPVAAIDRVSVTIEPPMGIKPQYVVVLNSSEPILLESFRAELTQHTVPGELLGRPLLESQQAFAPSLCLADDQTLLVGPKLYLKRLLRGVEGSGTELAEVMQADRGDENHLHGAIVLEPLNPMLELARAQPQAESHPEAVALLDGISQLRHVVIAINLSEEPSAALTVRTKDAAAADRLEELMADGLFWFRKEFQSDEKYSELRNSPESTVRALTAYIDRMFDLQAERMSTLRKADDTFVIDSFATGYTSEMGATMTIGVLVALLLPAVQAAREAARRNQSMSHLKQILLALHSYASDHGHLPAQAIYAPDGTPLLSWRVAILPYLEEQTLYDRFKLDEPWDSPHNRSLLGEMPEVYNDPSSIRPPTDGKTDYLGVAGPAATFDGTPNGLHLAAIADGTANTLAVVQVNQAEGVIGVAWTKPEDYDVVANATDPAGGIRSLHPGVFLGGFADGSVSVIPLDTDPDTLRKLMTADGGEVVARP